jgi:hypothetical protein
MVLGDNSLQVQLKLAKNLYPDGDWQDHDEAADDAQESLPSAAQATIPISPAGSCAEPPAGSSTEAIAE